MSARESKNRGTDEFENVAAMQNARSTRALVVRIVVVERITRT